MVKRDLNEQYMDTARVLHERAVRLAELVEEEQQEDGMRILVLQVSDEWYALDVACVREVLRGASITHVPCTPPHVMGVLSLRGEIISVCDLGIMCGSAGGSRAARPPIVIVRLRDVVTGLAVDDIEDIVEVPTAAIGPTLVTVDRRKAECVFGEATLGGKLVAILNLERLIGQGGDENILVG